MQMLTVKGPFAMFLFLSNMGCHTFQTSAYFLREKKGASHVLGESQTNTGIFSPFSNILKTAERARIFMPLRKSVSRADDDDRRN